MNKTNEERAIEYVNRRYTDNITYDTYKKDYYYNNERLSISDLRYEMMKEEGIKIDTEILNLILEKECQNRINRLEHYLNSVNLEYGENDSIEHLSNVILSCDTEIEKKYVRKFLISAVSRVFDPGCKVDQMLVFQSDKGGLGKTMFFTELAQLENFTSQNFNSNNMELRKTCSNYWIVLFDEMDAGLTPKRLSEFKTFVTDRKDTWRKYYTTDQQVDKLRTYVMCGTTNKRQLLIDNGAERRFWVIEIKNKIDIKWVIENRDMIWSQAVHLYRSGEQWWLTEEEQIESNEINVKFKDSDPYDDEIIASALSQNQPFTLVTIAEDLNVPLTERRKFFKYAKTLLENRTPLKYPEKQTRHNGARGYWWQPIVRKQGD